MSVREGFRPIEEGVHTDFRESMSYADYLDLDQLLAAQHLRSDPPHHDELLFIVQHQTTELWLKLMLHELRGVRAYLDADHVHHALKCLARVKHIQRTLTEQWSVLATLTPSEYAEFRGTLGSASGFQSAQYRAVEFILGNKNEQMLKVFVSDQAAYAMLAELLEQPSVYDAFLELSGPPRAGGSRRRAAARRTATLGAAAGVDPGLPVHLRRRRPGVRPLRSVRIPDRC